MWSFKEKVQRKVPLLSIVLSTTQEFNISSVRLMFQERKRRKPDLFSVLLILVMVGMSVTLAYQISVYYGVDQIPIAKRAPTVSSAGG